MKPRLSAYRDLVSRTGSSFANVCDALKDRICRSRPRERPRLLVVVIEVITDRLFKGCDAVEGAAANSPFCDLLEEPFDLVEPAGARRCEVNVVIGVALEPQPHSRGLVRGVVVHHEVNLLPGLLVERPVEVPKKDEKLLMPVLPEALPDHGPRRDIEGGKEACRAVTVEVERPPLRRAGLQRQQRL